MISLLLLEPDIISADGNSSQETPFPETAAQGARNLAAGGRGGEKGTGRTTMPEERKPPTSTCSIPDPKIATVDINP